MTGRKAMDKVEMTTEQTNKLFKVAKRINRQYSKEEDKDIIFWIAEQIKEYIDDK